MTRDAVLARGRAAAERGMIDSCVITRKTGETTTDLGGITYTYDQIYPVPPAISGKCRLQQTQAQGRSETTGEAYVIMAQRELQLPVASSTGIQAEDIVTITSCVHDPDLVGKVFVVRDEHGKTEATARRLTVQERTG